MEPERGLSAGIERSELLAPPAPAIPAVSDKSQGFGDGVPIQVGSFLVWLKYTSAGVR
jgi:hypothetical protein